MDTTIRFHKALEVELNDYEVSLMNAGYTSVITQNMLQAIRTYLVKWRGDRSDDEVHREARHLMLSGLGFCSHKSLGGPRNFINYLSAGLRPRSPAEGTPLEHNPPPVPRLNKHRKFMTIGEQEAIEKARAKRERKAEALRRQMR